MSADLTTFCCRSSQRERVVDLAGYVRQLSVPARDSLPSARDVLEYLLWLGESEAKLSPAMRDAVRLILAGEKDRAIAALSAIED